MGAAPHTRFPHPQTLNHFRFCMGCERGVLLCKRGQASCKSRTQGNPASPVTKTSHPFGKHFIEKLRPQAGLPACFAAQTTPAHGYMGVGVVQEHRHSLVCAKFGRGRRDFSKHRTTSAQGPSLILGLQRKPKEMVCKGSPFLCLCG